MKGKLLVLTFGLSVLLLVRSAQAADPATTSIAVEKMCCGGCAKKIAAKLYVIRGVKAVQCDVKARTVYVTPQQKFVLSPKALWEAVELGEDRPLQLAGPSGTFTSKPRY